jgi:DNA-binding XRE family transcriptional regulator
MEPIQPSILANRVEDLMAHTTRYAFMGPSRLSKDSGVSRSTISRLMQGKSRPSYLTVLKLAAALERAVGGRIDLRDLVGLAHLPPSSTPCQIAGCPGCSLSVGPGQTAEKAP